MEEDLLDDLLATVPWHAERRQMYDRLVDVPRLVSFYDLAVDDPPHPALGRLRRRLNDIYAGELGEPFTTVGLCCYRDGSDSVAWHGDTIGRSSSEDTMVAIVSLGATRTFAMRKTRRRPGVAAAAVARRSVGDGRVVPAHLGTRGPQNVVTSRPARQHPVPAARRAIAAPSGQPRIAATALTSRSRARWVSTLATGWSGMTSGLAMTITW